MVTDYFLKRNQDWQKKVVKRSNLTLKEFNRLLKENEGELYLTAKEAVEYGFADHVGLPLIKETRKWTLELPGTSR